MNILLPQTIPQALVLVLALSVPWAALLRRMRTGQGMGDETRETTLLALMAGVPLLGVILVLLSPLMPVAASAPLPVPGIDPAPQSGTVGDGGDQTALPFTVLGAAASVLLGFYALGCAVGIGRLAGALWRLGRLASRAAGSSAHGPDVRIGTDNRLPPLAWIGGQVLLPSRLVAALRADRLALVIAHERAHLSRCDPWRFLALGLTDILFWANPFIRQQTDACRLAAELECDGRVLAAFPRMRRTYAQTLVEVLKQAAGAAPACAPAVFSHQTQGDHSVRLSHIMKGAPVSRKAPSRTLLAGLAALALPFAAVQGALAWSLAKPDLSVRPVEGRLTSVYGPRTHPVTKKEQRHHGVDIAAPVGTPVRAPGAGRVVRMQEKASGYGLMMEVDHGEGYVTRYAQLDSFDVSFGDRIRPGQTIARVGSSGQSTGPHLHLEVFVDGKRVDPMTVLDLPQKQKD